ncbi:16S rRNA (uracil(1498)-N(3))-methyltransferase [Synechococcus sp. CC9616]|uniref:16S rRNA (uracil(1498)-N(3))-methyltransferase n=1 Tax=Synechococcus sp. CC9616 TaxID=110663 RepID=UPI0004912AFC|nr:16S rRNA (uracil(1498)-N(3))-methyltransferase [Synechococcus sp. CC9616]
MAELRRLLVDPARLDRLADGERQLQLLPDESHYLRRVLRLRSGDAVAVVDGTGGCWTACLLGSDQLEIPAGQNLSQRVPAPEPPLGVAAVLMRRGMEDWLRMGCELGVDRFQPLTSDRRVVQADHRPQRWSVILREAVEQCERLWSPQLADLNSLDAWCPETEALVGFAVTREETVPCAEDWLMGCADRARPIWIVIGPEGGWSERERQLADQRGWQPVRLGDSILRSSTAAVRAAVTLVSWRSRSKERSSTGA